jgi:cytochrome c oxidase assembly protein subunit 20
MRSLWSAGNWAVGVFAVTSLAAYEFCRRQRIEEMHGMKQAVELMKELKDKKQRDKEKAIEAAAIRAEEERQKKSWTNPSNYKFW